jgi:hypothetical protein
MLAFMGVTLVLALALLGLLLALACPGGVTKLALRAVPHGTVDV